MALHHVYDVREELGILIQKYMCRKTVLSPRVNAGLQIGDPRLFVIDRGEFNSTGNRSSRSNSFSV